MTSPIELLYKFDQYLTYQLQQHSFTANLLIHPTSKFITEILVIIVIGLISYESIYWTGIYLGLWEYHAKDIFTEVPIHCAHLSVRMNIISQQDKNKLLEYYQLKQLSKYNPLYWNKLNLLSEEIFKLNKFIKYYYEFSPEDFEMNKEPEFGSTIEHLRTKTLNLFRESDLYKEYHCHDLTIRNVLVFNNKNDEVRQDQDLNYLSKCNIETGNVIDCVIVI
ncbi:uncharacterized protein J8A68_001386 [[Candida] subhashii]|uniref:Uncharacterized protein n=1 Tax=[Candida] subhashii TaxID=561895 RepID=A0A8J5QU82_9ASCO|nr:uncharacterized protein J8A68_001386 [[Candida] subhashii]KAG7665077.1 hypothetical protein J8A68_001386 [[Candida] subhashii]